MADDMRWLWIMDYQDFRRILIVDDPKRNGKLSHITEDDLHSPSGMKAHDGLDKKMGQ